MKKSNKGTVFIMVMILITLSMLIAYIVFENMMSMDSNLLFSRNERELNKNLQQKAEINFKAMEEFYLDGDRTNNNFSRLNLLSIVPANSSYYNVFWNTKELAAAVDGNTLNVPAAYYLNLLDV
jgi:hypothetical protein